MSRKPKKLYSTGPQSLHDVRRILNVPIIGHTGRVNTYARCMGGKLKGHYDDLVGIRKIMAENVKACGGVPKTDTAGRAALKLKRKLASRKR